MKKKIMWFLGKCPSSLHSHPLLWNYFYFHQVLIFSLALKNVSSRRWVQFWRIILLKFLPVSNVPEYLGAHFTMKECRILTTELQARISAQQPSHSIKYWSSPFAIVDCPWNTSMNFAHSIFETWLTFSWDCPTKFQLKSSFNSMRGDLEGMFTKETLGLSTKTTTQEYKEI